MNTWQKWLCATLAATSVAAAAPVRDAFAQTSVQVVLRDGSISPSSIRAKQGQPVNLTVVNAGTKVHNLVVPAFYIFTQNLQPGERVTASFTPDKTGSFPYYSDTGGRPEPGMRGTLTVTR